MVVSIMTVILPVWYECISGAIKEGYKLAQWIHPFVFTLKTKCRVGL